MIIVSHRGNLLGPDPERENTLEAIDLALTAGFYVEVDIWRKEDGWYLGHDYPKTKFDFSSVSLKDLEKIMFHCKNLKAMEDMFTLLNLRGRLIYFYHNVDNATMLSIGIHWTYPGYRLSSGIACEPNQKEYNESFKNVVGICTDYPIEFKKSLPI